MPLALLGYAFARSGGRTEADRILQELLDRQGREYVAPTSLAVLYAGLGDTSETYAWLRRAVEARDPFLLYNFVSDSIMAPIRRSAQGREIIRRMGLERWSH